MSEWLCYTDGSCKAGDGAPGGWGFSVKPPQGPALEGWGKECANSSSQGYELNQNRRQRIADR